jgi:hypothetical protein
MRPIGSLGGLVSAVSFCPTSEPMRTEVHSSISFLLPIPASRLFRLPPALALESCSPYFTNLNMEAIRSSETSVVFRQYIVVDITLHFADF